MIRRGRVLFPKIGWSEGWSEAIFLIWRGIRIMNGAMMVPCKNGKKLALKYGAYSSVLNEFSFVVLWFMKAEGVRFGLNDFGCSRTRMLILDRIQNEAGVTVPCRNGKKLAIKWMAMIWGGQRRVRNARSHDEESSKKSDAPRGCFCWTVSSEVTV
jgi:hypothetical protein